MIERLKALQATKGKYKSPGFDQLHSDLDVGGSLRHEVECLAKAFLHRTVHGCSNCYMDAYLELINLNIEKAMEYVECQFSLLAGALLRDVNGNMKYLCSQANITNELALYHLKTNPKSVDMFESLPKGWEKMVRNFKLSEAEQAFVESKKQVDNQELAKALDKIEELEKASEANSNLILDKDNRISTLEHQVVTKDKEIDQLASQVQTLERGLNIIQAVQANDMQSLIGLLTREELAIFVEENKLDIVVTDDVPLENIKKAILAQYEKIHKQAEAKPETKESDTEDNLAIEIAKKLKAGVTKSAIKETYKGSRVGEKKLTIKLLDELIARAEELNK